MRRSSPGIIATLLGLLACTNAGSNLTLPKLSSGSVGVGAFLDRNDTHALDAGDTSYAGLRIALLVPGGTDTIRTAVTDSAGLAHFDSLPIGTYRLVVDRHALSDTIGTIAGDTGTFRITGLADSLQKSLVLRLGYTEMSIAAARAAPPGMRVVIHGKVTSPRQAFHDSSAFVVDTSGSIRITGATGRAGTTGNAIGDSVLVLGTTGQDLGEGVLVGGFFTTISQGIAPPPTVLAVADARTALGGVDDAVLAQLTGVIIRDTAASGAGFKIVVSDPADSTIRMNVILDQLIIVPRTLFAPKRSMTVRGVLVPVGDGTWVLKPRSTLDIVFN